ncbi:hypothetical protein DK45_4262 [Bordetella bronchiseptica]|nr:hypothetical protein DK45_4262 [Bordetella bronchiseptica]
MNRPASLDLSSRFVPRAGSCAINGWRMFP